MNDEFVGLKIVRIITSRGTPDIQFHTHVLPEPARDLHPTDIVFHRMMTAGFRDQDFIPGFQGIDRRDSMTASANFSLTF